MCTTSPSSSRATESTASSSSSSAASRRGASVSIRTVRADCASSCCTPSGVPSATSRPLTTTSTRSAIRSTSARMCEDTSTVRPCSPSRRMRSTSARRCAGSRPLSGSSMSSTSGSCTRACASRTRCRIPLEKPATRRSAAASSPTVDSAWAVAPSTSPTRRCRARKATVWRAVRKDHSPSPSGTSPSRACTSGSRRGSWPRTRTVPWLGELKPASRSNRVDLPAPLWPSSPVTPGSEVKLTSDSATVSPNHLDTRSTVIAAVMRRPGCGSAAAARLRPAARRLRRWPTRGRPAAAPRRPPRRSRPAAARSTPRATAQA
ncbi:hypothetical protein BH24ACT10_BH24ACT10_06750 [soil metagenome]